MHPQLQGRQRSPKALTARRFFEDICPQVLAARTAIIEKLGGTYGFRVHGAGEWTLDFATAAVRTGGFDDADLRIETHAEELARMMSGTLDVQAAYAAGRFLVEGRRKLLQNLTAALRPA